MEQARDTELILDETSRPFVGRWNRLVSTTNWDKGRIIHEWRVALMSSEAASTEYSDDAWSRLVGGVSGQHAGRLRRVYDRFGDVYEQYEGLYWSHFQAALDWDDAEMWLEGALQSGWSVNETRRRRWETLGAIKEDEPRADELVNAELDEDFSANSERSGSDSTPPQDRVASEYMAEARSPAGPDFGDEDDVPSGPLAVYDGEHDSSDLSGARTPNELVRPLAELPELPQDLADAFEAYQLAILRHKANHWGDISQDDVLASLEALKGLVLAPAEA